MISFKFRNLKVPSNGASFKKYKQINNTKNENTKDDLPFVYPDGKTVFVETKNTYDCEIYSAFRNLGKSELDVDGVKEIFLTSSTINVGLTEEIAINMILEESLRIIKLSVSTYNLTDHERVHNYLYPLLGKGDRESAVEYIIEHASDFLGKNYKKGNIIESRRVHKQTSKFRNPLIGYRKTGVNCNDLVQEIYKDPFSKHLVKYKSATVEESRSLNKVCYDKRIRSIINKGGDVDMSYNNTYSEYIKKRSTCNIIKNTNQQYYQSGAVTSSSRLAKLKVDTFKGITKDCCGDYNKINRFNLLGIVKPKESMCDKINITDCTKYRYMIINGRRRIKR